MVAVAGDQPVGVAWISLEPIRVVALPSHEEPELVKPAEHGQVRAAESGIPALADGGRRPVTGHASAAAGFSAGDRAAGSRARRPRRWLGLRRDVAACPSDTERVGASALDSHGPERGDWL